MVECRGLNLLYLEIGASCLLSGESNLVFVMLVSLLGVVVRRVVVSFVRVRRMVVLGVLFVCRVVVSLVVVLGVLFVCRMVVSLVGVSSVIVCVLIV